MSEYAPELTPYTNQVGQANNATEHLVGRVTELAFGIGGVRAVAGGVAADFQQMAAGVRAASTVTQQSYGQLSAATRQLTKDFPMATGAALATVQAVQSLGVTSRNQVGQVRALSQEMARLGGATGSNIPALTMSFGQLTRQMASLDPARVGRFGDVLTTLSAKSGTSAIGITQFAQAIAPMAQAAGIGEASVLGISTSFAKLGQDGYVAANTVTKMLSDMNRAVRDGSNDMTGYANAVGMTSQQFTSLFKQNPAEALTRVTEAIARMPSGQGQRTLEQLGIEGVRGQRSLLAVAQAGGLRQDISTALGAYGSGSTAAASRAAYAGVESGLTRLQNAAEDVAGAFERPLLGSVQRIVDATSGFTRGVGGIVGSRPAQDVLGLASQAALPYLGLRLAGRLTSGGALASFLMRSGPMAGLAAGVGAGRAGGSLAALEAVPRTQGVANMLQADVVGAQMGRTANMAAINQRLFHLGAGLGAMFPAGTGGGASLLRQGAGFGVLGLGAAARSQAELFRLARMPGIERDAYLQRPYGDATQRFLQNRQSLQGAMAAGTIGRGEYTAALRRELMLLAESSGTAGGAVRQLGASLGVLSVEMGKTALTGARAIGAGAARGAMNLVGGPMGLAMIGGTMAFEAYQAHTGEVQRREQHYNSLDVFDTVNAYRDAMGQAGEAAQSLSGQLTSAAASVSAAVTTITQATTVTGADTAAATRNRNIVQRYSGTTSQVAAQIAGIDTRGLQPSDLQGAKLDLIRLQQAGQLPGNFDINKALTDASQMGSGLGPTQISNMVAGMAAAPDLGHVGFGWTWLKRGPNYRGSIAMDTLGHTGYGSPQLGKTAGSEVDLLAGSLGQRQQDLTSRYGPRYAASQTLQSANQAINAALKSGNADLVVGMEQELSNRLTGKTLTGISASDIRKAGGFSQLLANRNLRVNNVDVASLLSGGSVARPGMQEDVIASQLFNQFGGNGVGQFFSNYNQAGGNRGRRALAAAASSPDNLQKQAEAITAIVDSSRNAGMSLQQLAAQAASSTAKMADGDARRAVMIGVLAEATRRLQNQMGGMTIGQRFGAQASLATQLSQVSGNSQEAVQARAQGAQQAAATVQSEREYMQQRLMAQFQFQVQSERSYHDYYLSVSRADEDFQLSLSRSESDFQRQRGRQLRDFNIQIARQQEDAARTMYNPYERIQAKPIYDAGNLLMNMQEQLQAMRQQVRNVNKLRDLGMTDQTLQLLGAYDPNNAQQVQELVNDLQNDRGLVRQYNSDAAQRQKVAGQLLSDDPTFKRQRQDFQRSLRDSAQDYQIARNRQIDDFHRAMDRQATDFQTQMSRMQQDLTNSDREITGSMTNLQRDMNKILHGQSVDWTTQLRNNLRNTVNIIQQWTPRLLKAQNNALNTGSSGSSTGYITGVPGGPGRVSGLHRVSGDGVNAGFLLSSASRPGTDTDRMGNPNLHWGTNIANAPKPTNLSANAALAKRMAGNYSWGDGAEWAALYQIWSQESGFRTTAGSINAAYGIPQADPGTKMSTAGADWRTNPNTQIAWGLDYILRAYGDPLGAWAHKSRTGWYGEGSIFRGAQVIGVGEKGSEAVIPLNEHGIGVLAQAFADYLGPNEARSLGGGGRAHAIYIEHHGNIVYDHSVQFPGAEISVASEDPTQFARKAEAKVRRDNLTAARGVPWSTT